MKERSLYKKIANELAAWDLNPGCRRIVNQSSKARRNLKRKLLRAARKQLEAAIRNFNIDLT